MTLLIGCIVTITLALSFCHSEHHHEDYYFHPQSAPPTKPSQKEQYLSPYRDLCNLANSDCKWNNDEVERLPLPLESLSDPNPSTMLKKEEISCCRTPRRMVIQSPSIHPSMGRASNHRQRRRNKLDVLAPDISGGGGHGGGGHAHSIPVGNLVDL